MSDIQYSNVSQEEWDFAENIRDQIAEGCKSYFIEKVNPNASDFVQSVVTVPVTENLKMPVVINVPKKMMDEDNTALLEYLVEHVYQPDPDSFMAEMVNKQISKKQEDLKKFEENLASFNAAEFMSE